MSGSVHEVKGQRPVIFFDAAGTLIRLARPVGDFYSEISSRFGALTSPARLAVISNFDTRLRAILSGHGLLSRFEHIVISSEVGCEKPHPSIFRHALHLMRVPPSLCLHVGDDPVRDWAAAGAVGIRSFRLRRPANSLLDLAAGE